MQEGAGELRAQGKSFLRDSTAGLASGDSR